MYLQDYFIFILALLACMVFSMIASGKVRSAYSAYSRVPCRSGLSGRDAAAYADALLPDTASVDAAPIAAYLDEIITELRTHPTGFEVRCAGLLLCVLSETARRIARPDPSMAALTAWLDAHYAEPLTLAQMAAQIPLSATHFWAQFKAAYGCTPTELLQRTRIAEAKRRLQMTDEPVTAVALACGFDSPAYFAQVFRARVGCTPTRYRDRHRARMG